MFSGGPRTQTGTNLPQTTLLYGFPFTTPHRATYVVLLPSSTITQQHGHHLEITVKCRM